jgi:hypothetical protein
MQMGIAAAVAGSRGELPHAGNPLVNTYETFDFGLIRSACCTRRTGAGPGRVRISSTTSADNAVVRAQRGGVRRRAHKTFATKTPKN